MRPQKTSLPGTKLPKTLALLFPLLLAACDYVPFSGGALAGTPTPPPAQWTEAAAPEVIELETNPAEPYSVKLWIIGLGPELYIHAGANRATWVEHIESDPRVKVLIGNALYELTAERVTDQAEFDRFGEARKAKYGRLPRNKNVNESYLFRLLPRLP